MLQSTGTKQVLDKATEQALDKAYGYINVARKYEKGGMYHSAVEPYLLALSSLPAERIEKANILESLSKCYYQLGMYNQAKQKVRELFEFLVLPSVTSIMTRKDIFITLVRGNELVADCYWRQNSYPQAIDSYNVALEVANDWPEIRQRILDKKLNLLYLQIKNYLKAKELEHALINYNVMFDDFCWTLEQSKDILRKQFELIEQLAQNQDEYQVQLNVCSQFFRALDLMKQGDYFSAANNLKLLLEVVEIKPYGSKHGVIGFYYLAKCYMKQGIYQAALAAFKTSYGLSTNSKFNSLHIKDLTYVMHCMGVCHTHLKNFTAALQHFDEALSSRELSRYWQALVSHDKAICLSLDKNHREAIIYYNSALEEKEFKGLQRIAAMYGIAKSYAAQKDYNKARQFCLNAIVHLDELMSSKQQPDNDEIRYIRSTIVNFECQLPGKQQNPMPQLKHQSNTALMKISKEKKAQSTASISTCTPLWSKFTGAAKHSTRLTDEKIKSAGPSQGLSLSLSK